MSNREVGALFWSLFSALWVPLGGPLASFGSFWHPQVSLGTLLAGLGVPRLSFVLFHLILSSLWVCCFCILGMRGRGRTQRGRRPHYLASAWLLSFTSRLVIVDVAGGICTTDVLSVSMLDHV